MKADMIRSATPTPVPFSHAQAWNQPNDLSMLHSEVEMLMAEDTQLMKIAGAAALFVSQLKDATLPASALPAASVLAKLISEIPDDTMSDALDLLSH